MKIISWNVNGLRAVERKEELQKFLKKHDPDIFCIQEIKMQESHSQQFIDGYQEYNQSYQYAEKAGYSGVSIWSKKKLPEPTVTIGFEGKDDHEGRIIRADFGDTFTLLNCYFPNGGKSVDAFAYKLEFYDRFLAYVNDLRKKGKTVMWTGDINCAHNEIDIARPKDNDGKIGFHPKERAWLDRVIEQKWADTFRKQYPDEVKYSYWHLISRARVRNVGWRIDYFFVDETIFKQVINTDYDNDQMGSDHCPVVITVNESIMD